MNPLSREQQIELMRDADQRIEARVKTWLRSRLFRNLVSKPAPNQEADTRVTHHEIKVARG